VGRTPVVFRTASSNASNGLGVSDKKRVAASVPASFAQNEGKSDEKSTHDAPAG
jgi:hypothetical protein